MKRVMNQIESEDQIMIDCSILKTLHQISPRITRLYQNFTNILLQDRSRHFSPDQYKGKLQRIFQKITYGKDSIGSPICRQSSKSTLFYHCFDCEKDTLTSICEGCFLQGQHLGHNFRTYSCECYCDCGNEQILNKQYFCTKHKYFQQPKQMNGKQAQIFTKQLQFLLLLAFYHFNNLKNLMQKKRQSFLSLVLSLFKKYLKINYNYQKLATKVLLNKFDRNYHYSEDDSILQLLMIKIGWSEKIIKEISKFLIQLQPVYEARIQLIVHYWNILNQGLKTLKIIEKMQTLDSQLMSQSQIILNLLKKGTITSLQIGQDIQTSKEQIGKYYILFKLYQNFSSSIYFGEIISIILTQISISSFYNYHNCAKQSQNSQILQNNYLKLFIQILKKIILLQNRKKLLLKMIRQSYRYLKQCHNKLRRCPKITFSLCLFALFDFDMYKLISITQHQLLTILQVNEGQRICQFLNKLIWQQNTLILNIQKQDRQLSNNPQLFLSTEYLFYKIVYAIHQIIKKQQQIDLSSYIENDLVRLKQKVQNLYMKKPQEIALQVFLATEQGYRICKTLLNIIYSCQTDLPETIVGNCLHRGNRIKILQFYRSLYIINREMTRVNFKIYAESWIQNQEYLREFIQESFNFNKQQSYTVNLSFLSEYCQFHKVSKDEKIERIKMNLAHNNQELDNVLGSSLKVVEELLAFLTKKTIQSTMADQSRYLIEILMVMFLWTKADKYWELIDAIFNSDSAERIQGQYVQYRVIIKEAIQKKSEKKTSKQSNKSKRQQKLLKIRQSQQKCLKQHQQQLSLVQKNTNKQQNSCIVCRQSKNEKLSYLCHASFTNNFTKEVFHEDNDHYVLIHTCGHVIHENCLSSNVNPNHLYSEKLSCFLCKKMSNLRIPFYPFYTEQTQKELRQNQTEKRKFNRYYKFVQQLMTVLSLQKGEIQTVKEIETDLKIQKFGEIISKSIIHSVYFYFLSFPKVYITYMLPFLSSLFSLVNFSIENKLSDGIYKSKYQRVDIELQEVQKLFMQVINKPRQSKIIHQGTIQDILKQQQYSPKLQLLKLKLYLTNHTNIPFNYTKTINRLRLYNLPKDLIQLNKQIGKCHTCGRIHSKIKICIYCRQKICVRCKYNLQSHINSKHGGGTIMIDTQFGQYYYYYNKSNIRCQSLYCNYIGQSFPYEHRKPKQGYYLLDEKQEETIIINAMLQNMEQVVSYQNVNDRCQIQ